MMSDECRMMNDECSRPSDVGPPGCRGRPKDGREHSRPHARPKMPGPVACWLSELVDRGMETEDIFGMLRSAIDAMIVLRDMRRREEKVQRMMNDD